MPVTPKSSFRLSAEVTSAIADVQALLSAKRSDGKSVSQAEAIRGRASERDGVLT